MKKTLLTPGPVPLHKSTQEILSDQIWHHRIPEFEQVLKNSLDGLNKLFDCDGHVFILNSSGSGGMEAGIVNFLSPGDRILVIVSGKFGQRWRQMAETFELEVDALEVEWGETVDIDRLKNQLKQHKYSAVLTQACETSTAVLHPLDEISSAIQQTDSSDAQSPLLIVDGITAVGAIPLSMRKLKIDVLIGGSQKAFALPTGLSFVGCSGRALDHMKTAGCKRFYLDLIPELQANQKNQTRFSSATSMIRALENNLNEIFTKGLENHFADINHLAERTRKAFAAIDMKLFSSAPSASVTAALVKSGQDSGKIRSELERNFGITIMGGQDQLKGKILRIGHMGNISNENMRDFFKALTQTVNQLYPNSISDHQLNKALELFQ